MSLRPSHPAFKKLTVEETEFIKHLKSWVELSLFSYVEETETKSQGVSCSLDGWIVF